MSFILYDSDDPDGGSIFLDPPKTEIDNEIESGVNRKRFLWFPPFYEKRDTVKNPIWSHTLFYIFCHNVTQLQNLFYHQKKASFLVFILANEYFYLCFVVIQRPFYINKMQILTKSMKILNSGRKFRRKLCHL